MRTRIEIGDEDEDVDEADGDVDRDDMHREESRRTRNITETTPGGLI